MGKGVVAEEHDIEGRRPYGERPEVGDQRNERQAPHYRFASRPGDSTDGEIRACDTEAPCEKAERLGADTQRSVQHSVRVHSPVFRDERCQRPTLPRNARLPVFVDEVIPRRQVVIERSDRHYVLLWSNVRVSAAAALCSFLTSRYPAAVGCKRR